MLKRGDPEGRRLAQRRAGLLHEAERVARALEILLDRAEHPKDAVSDLITELARQQQRELQKANGRIEPRTRFKSRGGHPLLKRLPVAALYIDESGTSTIPKDRGAEYFALGAISMEKEEAQRYIARADTIKLEFFGRTDFQFHDPYMRQRTQARHVDYSFSRDASKQKQFDDAIRELITSCNFMTFGVGIRKTAFRDEFIKHKIDPYLPLDVYCVAITFLLERYVDALAHADSEQMGQVRAESQGPREDAYHQMEYARLLLEGSQWVSASAFQSHLHAGMRFSPKSGSDPSELADMFARDLFEWTRGECTGKSKWWDLFSSKVYVRGDGQMGKFGIKIFPDTDIRERIESHRKAWGATEARQEKSATPQGGEAPIA